MVDIQAFGKAEMSKVGLKFISVPVLSIPYMDKTFYTKTVWGSSIEDIKGKLSAYNPVIIFDQTGKYGKDSVRGFAEKLPKDWKMPTAIFVRVIHDLDASTWSKIMSNIFEPENMNFTFAWDFEHYTDPQLEVYNKKTANKKMAQLSYDERERLEHAKAHTANKISFRRH
jgi:hypothetical protein